MLGIFRLFSHRRVLMAPLALIAFMATTGQSRAALIWNWNYSGTGISAAGTFTTVDTADALGFYKITAITGTRNGIAITGLQPAGTPIPGNEPFAVDNLIRLSGHQLTGDGFGYSTAAGTYVSPFFADFLTVPGYLEVFSAPPIVSGSDNFGPEDSELPVVFSATPVPEPATAIMMAAGLGVLLVTRRRLTTSRSRLSL